MSKVLSIARATIIGNLRNRVFLVLALFGGILLGAALILGLLGQEQEVRVLLDLGLASIETLSLFTAVFLIANIILEEIDSKTIYLVLTRSVGRAQYLFGRYAGTLASVALAAALMTALHLALLIWKGWSVGGEGVQYATAVLMSFEKILLITAIGLFFSLSSSSAVVALVFTLFFWLLGHFALEMRFLIDQTRSEPARWLLKAIYAVIPHFQYLNARDLWIAAPGQMAEFLMRGTLYSIGYSAAFFLLALRVFQRKEF